MDWFILICLVPLTIIPIVLLGGFAGCSSFGGDGGASAPAAPTNLQAVAEGPLQVKLTWQYPGTVSAQFTVLRAKSGDKLAQIDTLAASTAAMLAYSDMNKNAGLEEATNFIYSTVATVGGSDSPQSMPVTVTTLPNTPTDLMAVPVENDILLLSWKNNSTKANRFQLEHRSPAGAGAWAVIYTGPNLSFSHTLPPLVGSDTHEYRVFAIATGWDNKDVLSQPSSSIKPVRPVWQTTFTEGPNAIMGTDDGGYKGQCMVQKLPKNSLSFSGNAIRLTLRGSTTGNLNFDAVYISRVAAMGDPYDSAADLTQVRFTGSSSVSILPNTSVRSDVVAYQLDAGQDLLIAFDVNHGNDAGSVRKRALNSAFLYHQDTVEAGKMDRASGYNGDNVNSVFNVEKIEVTTTA